ncbi:MAG: ABC transporter permease [Armatimonadota bacterium]
MFLRMRMIMWKEFVQISRDPRLLAVVVVIPMIMLLLYGFAINLDVRNLRLAVYDQDRSPASRQLTDVFTQSTYFQIVGYLHDHRQVIRELDGNHAQLVLIIPPTYSRNLADGRAAQVQVLVNGSDSTTAGTGISYIAAILQQQSAKVSLEALARDGVNVTRVVQPVDNRIRFWYNAELRSTNFLVPGLVAVILMMLAALLTSVTVVRERERGTIEQLIVSPVRPIELMLGKLIPYVAIAFCDVLLILLVGVYVFQVPFRGSPWLVLGISAIFVTAALGIGLLVSTVAPNQQLALLAAMLTTQLPSVLLSGFIFPISSMPAFLQWFTLIIPARHFIKILRGVIMKGNGPAEVWPSALGLLIFALVMLGLSAARFKKKL